MSILSARPIPFYANPCHEPALAALGDWLTNNHYSAWAMTRIVAHVRRTGELAGAVALELLDPTDEAAATEVYCENLPEVPESSPAWDDPAVYLDVASLVERDGVADRRRLAADPELAAIIREDPELTRAYADCLPPVAGGAPAGPSEADIVEAMERCRRLAMLDAIRQAEEYLGAFNEQRQDWTEVPA